MSLHGSMCIQPNDKIIYLLPRRNAKNHLPLLQYDLCWDCGTKGLSASVCVMNIHFNVS